MRQQLKEQFKTDYIEYVEVEKSRLEETEEEFEELEDRAILVKNTLFFIFVFVMGVAVGLHL